MKLRRHKLRTPEQALEAMLAHRDSGKTGFQGWCLKTCREAWGLPSDQPSAIKEWQSIPAERRHKTGQAPLAAPHFWAIGAFGHVALQAKHPARVIGTDSPTADKVGVVELGWFAKRWGAKYLGWSCEFQNRKVVTCPICDITDISDNSDI